MCVLKWSDSSVVNNNFQHTQNTFTCYKQIVTIYKCLIMKNKPFYIKLRRRMFCSCRIRPMLKIRGKKIKSKETNIDVTKFQCITFTKSAFYSPASGGFLSRLGQGQVFSQSHVYRINNVSIAKKSFGFIFVSRKYIKIHEMYVIQYIISQHCVHTTLTRIEV